MTSTRSFAAAGILFIACAQLPAQWLNYPTAGVPKKPDGSPNLGAPAPRTSDGKPDFSGIWEAEKNQPCPADGCPDGPTGKEFFDIAWSIKGGLPYQPWARALVKERLSQNRKDNPNARCLPLGVVGTHTFPLLRKIVQVPGLIVTLNERNAMYRQIFTDGRALPEDPLPSFNGYSTGKWDGDTLVVQTNGFRDGIWLDANGDPLTESGKITERFRRVDYGHMEVRVTVDDPKAYTAPWTVTLNQFIVLDTELLDFVCLENEKDVKHLVGK
jgi:hypothetical protein